MHLVELAPYVQFFFTFKSIMTFDEKDKFITKSLKERKKTLQCNQNAEIVSWH